MRHPAIRCHSEGGATRCFAPAWRAWRRPKNLNAGRTVLSVTMVRREKPRPFPIEILRSAPGLGAWKTVSRGASLRITVIVRTHCFYGFGRAWGVHPHLKNQLRYKAVDLACSRVQDAIRTADVPRKERTWVWP